MSDDHNEHFIIPLKYYVGTLVALLILTVITVAIAQVDLGPFNLFVAMFVASVKASFVIFFFMGVKWEEGFNKVILFGSLAFIALFLVVVLLDVFTRGDVYSNEDETFNIKSPVKLIDTSHSNYSNTH